MVYSPLIRSPLIVISVQRDVRTLWSTSPYSGQGDEGLQCDHQLLQILRLNLLDKQLWLVNNAGQPPTSPPPPITYRSRNLFLVSFEFRIMLELQQFRSKPWVKRTTSGHLRVSPLLGESSRLVSS